MGWGGDIAKDSVKGVVSAAALTVATLVWQHFFGTTPESAFKKASTPIQLLSWEVWLWAAITVFLVVFIAATLLRRRSPGGEAVGSSLVAALDPKIEIVTGLGRAIPGHRGSRRSRTEYGESRHQERGRQDAFEL
jgi:hypothetical protein